MGFIMEYSLYKTKKIAADKNNLEEAIKLVYKNLKSIQKEYEVYNVKRFGRLLEAEAYYHEVDQYYRCVGFEVEIESQFSFGEGNKLSDLETTVGFYSIWIGKSHSAAPITFEESYNPFGESNRFDNGLGDRVNVIKVIASKDEVQKIAEGIIS